MPLFMHKVKIIDFAFYMKYFNRQANLETWKMCVVFYPQNNAEI